MDDFELQLKGIRLAQPSGDLKRRVFGRGGRVVELFRWRMPLGWAAVLALFAGLLGMYLSQWLRGPEPASSRMVYVQIIEAPSERNLFDFTEVGSGFMPGDMDVRVKTPEEI
jgi:hypothetical protein